MINVKLAVLMDIIMINLNNHVKNVNYFVLNAFNIIIAFNVIIILF